MSTQLSTSKQVRGWLSHPEMQSRIGSALGGFMSGDMFMAQVALAVQEPAIAKCSPTSVFNAMLEVATMGLLPGKQHGHVALIPRRGELTVMPMFGGLKYLMERQPHVAQVKALLVHTSDTLEVEEGIVVRHAYDPFGEERVFQHWKDGECGLRGAYARIEYTDGTIDYHFVTAAKVKANADCAQNQANWRKWFPEYVVKTVYRDVYARRAIRLDPETEGRLGAVTVVEDKFEGNEPERGGHAVRPSERIAAPKGQDVLAQRLASASVEPAAYTAAELAEHEASIIEIDAMVAADEAGDCLLEGAELRDAQKKLRAMAGDCAKQTRANGDAKMYFEAVKKAGGVESSTEMSAQQVVRMEIYLRDDIEGREPLL